MGDFLKFPCTISKTFLILWLWLDVSKDNFRQLSHFFLIITFIFINIYIYFSILTNMDMKR
jgi:hypothetical protein